MSTVEQDAWLKGTFGLDPASAKPSRDGAKGGGPGKTFKAIKKMIVPPKPPPVPRTELGTAQSSRADKLLQSMKAEDQKKVNKLLEKATDNQKKYLKKALASQRTAVELEAFFAEIDGKDDAWMQDNLHVVGNSKGKGIKQQWECSCGPTTIQALRGELDPIYALKLRKDNPNLAKADDKSATKRNPNMAQEQKDMLEFSGGKATARSKSGEGIKLDDALGRSSVKSYLGMSFDAVETEKAGHNGILSDLDAALAEGLPVPIRVSSKGKDGGHFVLVTGGAAGTPRRYSVHDPWTGKTITIDENKIKAKKLDIAGWPEITHIYKPTVTLPPDAQPKTT